MVYIRNYTIRYAVGGSKLLWLPQCLLVEEKYRWVFHLDQMASIEREKSKRGTKSVSNGSVNDTFVNMVKSRLCPSIIKGKYQFLSVHLLKSCLNSSQRTTKGELK